MKSFALSLLLSLALASIALGQSDLSIVQEPTSPVEGDLVTLTVRFPEGYAGEFLPIFEANYRNFPEVDVAEVPPSEPGGEPKVETKIVGTGCSFSAGCQGAREIVVVLSSFRIVGKVVVPKTLRYVVKVAAKHGPKVPPDEPIPPPPEDPPTDLPEDPGTPIGSTGGTNPLEAKIDRLVASVAKLESDGEKITRILDNLATRTEGLEKRPASAAQVAAAPVVVKQTTIATSKTVGAVPFDSGGPYVPINGLSHPPANLAIAHLRAAEHRPNSPFDVSRYEPLERWSSGQLNTIHTYHHYGYAAPDADEASRLAASSYAMLTESYQAKPAKARASASLCPGGVCPTSSIPMGASYGPLGVVRWRR